MRYKPAASAEPADFGGGPHAHFTSPNGYGLNEKPTANVPYISGWAPRVSLHAGDTNSRGGAPTYTTSSADFALATGSNPHQPALRQPPVLILISRLRASRRFESRGTLEP
jgi:hypothetical protein